MPNNLPALNNHLTERIFPSSMNQNTGLDFEVYVQTLFENREIPVFETPTTNDYGADLVLYRNGKVAVIQCKYHSTPIGIHAVQEIVGAIKHYQADAGIVITNQPFTRQAIALAKSNHVLLIDGQRLQEVVDGVSDELPYIDEFLLKLKNKEFAPFEQQKFLLPVRHQQVCKNPVWVRLRRL